MGSSNGKPDVSLVGMIINILPYIDQRVPCIVTTQGHLQPLDFSPWIVVRWTSQSDGLVVTLRNCTTGDGQTTNVYSIQPMDTTPSPQKADDTMKAYRPNLLVDDAQMIYQLLSRVGKTPVGIVRNPDDYTILVGELQEYVINEFILEAPENIVMVIAVNLTTRNTEKFRINRLVVPVKDFTVDYKAKWGTAKQKDTGRLLLEHQISRFIDKKIPAKFDNEVLYHDPKSPCQATHWQVTDNGLLVTLANPNNKGYRVSSIVTKVMMPPRFVFEDSGVPDGTEVSTKDKPDCAVRSSDADAVAFHLVSPHALERLAARYQMGSDKYDDYNWTKGFSHGQILNHTLRHINHYLAGDRRDDHLAGAAWGLFTLMHYEETGTGTPDLKRYVETYDGIKPTTPNSDSPKTTGEGVQDLPKEK